MFLWIGASNAQVAVDPRGTSSQTYEERLAAEIAEAGGTAPPPPAGTERAAAGAPAANGLAYTATPELKAELGQVLYEEHQQAIDYNRRVFEWQMTSTQISFWIVIGLVGVGVIFAAIQFAKSMRGPGTVADPNTEIEISARGLKVTSPVLGVIILALSLGFFYLYLAHVYPIEHIRGTQPGGGSSAAEGDTP